jgi:hypothetical protein
MLSLVVSPSLLAIADEVIEQGLGGRQCDGVNSFALSAARPIGTHAQRPVQLIAILGSGAALINYARDPRDSFQAPRAY